MNTDTGEETSAIGSRVSKGGLFRAADGTSLALTFVLITSLFLLWGFCNGMIDILNKHFQDTLRINKEQSGLVQAANYLGYFLMAIPAGLLAKRFGYKGGILAGLSLIAAGAFWFIPAVNIGTYWAFLLGLLVIAAGMTCLETIANPYATALGAPESGPTRINIAQTVNGLGWILGPIVGGHFVFSGGDRTNANAGLTTPYLAIGIFVALLLIIFILSRVPDLHVEDEDQRFVERQDGAKPSGSSEGRHRCDCGCCLRFAVFLYRPDSHADVAFAAHGGSPASAIRSRHSHRHLCGSLPCGFKKLGSVPAQAFHPRNCRPVLLRCGTNRNIQLLRELHS